MRAFVCPRCRHLAAFESMSCSNCGALMGFDPFSASLEALQADGEELVRTGPAGVAGRWRRCSRWRSAQCNWLVPAAGTERLCASCRLTRRLPAQAGHDQPTPGRPRAAGRRTGPPPAAGPGTDAPGTDGRRTDGHQMGGPGTAPPAAVVARDPRPRAAYRAAFAKAEVAKRRLLFQLGQLRLPVVGRQEDPVGGLAFDLLALDHHVVTGHDNGVITIDLNETDDVFREQARAQFGEPYRTLLGHFRHEIGHYYWPHLVSGPLLAEARDVFGDHLSDYEDARRAHYARGARPGWQENYVSAYASMHPLEDWAETFAHYLHIWDTVQTAASFGVLVTGPVDDRTGRRDPANASVPSEDTAALEGFGAVIADWLPLTVALNAINRSLGRDDLYPFDLSGVVVGKLAFVHRAISARHSSGASGYGTSGG